MTVTRTGLALLAALATLAACMPAAAVAEAGLVSPPGPAAAMSRATLCADLDDPAVDVYPPAPPAPEPTPIQPGDVVDAHVTIDSLEPVPEALAFGELAAAGGRRLLQCRKCKCLPRCSRCLINSCRAGLCRGFCRVPAPDSRCTILTCSREQFPSAI